MESYARDIAGEEGKPWSECVYDIVDAASFGDACANAWTRLREQKS
jgi:hypothetical protein